MNARILFWDFVANFSLTIVIAAVVTFLYSLIVHGSGIINWEISFILAVVLSSVLLSQKMQGSKGR